MTIVRRRESFRVATRIAIKITAPKLRAAATGHTLDASAGGMRFKTDTRFQKGDVFTVSLTLGSDKVQSKFEVIRATPASAEFEVCGRFIEMAQRDEAVLTRYLLREETKLRHA